MTSYYWKNKALAPDSANLVSIRIELKRNIVIVQIGIYNIPTFQAEIR